MAYNSKNQVSEKLVDIPVGKRGDVIRVAKITDSEVESFDIRRMYLNDNDELQFTSKGIRIKKENISEVVCAIMRGLDTDTYNETITKMNKMQEDNEF